MANWGTYEGHNIISEAMDSTLNRQLETDKFNEAKKRWDIQNTLDEATTQETLERIEREKAATIRNNLLNEYTIEGYDNKDPNVYSKSNIIKNVPGVTPAELRSHEEGLKVLASERMANRLIEYNKLDETQKSDYILKNEDAIKTEQMQTGTYDSSISAQDMLEGYDTTSPLTNAYKVENWGGKQKFSDEDWGGNISVLTNDKIGSKKKQETQLLVNAIAKNKNSKSDNWMESDDTKLTQQSDGSWKLREDDLIGSDTYTVEIQNGQAMINMGSESDPEWELLREAGF